MASIFVLLVIILVVAAIIWRLRGQHTRVRSRSEHAARKSESQTAATKPGVLDKLRDSGMFWGVEIDQPGCEAARELRGQQFAFADAPELPLAGCSSAVCICQFKGLKDRRTGHRRKNVDRRGEVRFEEGQSDRRSPKNRRSSDSWNDHSY